MALKTSAEVLERLRKMDRNIYYRGEKIENPCDYPVFRPSLNSLLACYDLAQDPEYEDLMTTTSNLTGEKINRFTTLHMSREDLIKKVKMQRLVGQKTSACFQRCVIMDAANAFYSTTFDMDKKYGTNYHERFCEFLKYVQTEDLNVNLAVTDPKGDRSKRPQEQADPDLFLHVVERRPDGVVVVGAKAHFTGCTNGDEAFVMPTMSLRPGDEDYAIAFSMPTDAEGLTIIVGRQSSDLRKLYDGDMDNGNAEFGGIESLLVFDHVFIPNERIFLNGETEFVGPLVDMFASYHRNSYGGCKPGVGDVFIGACSLLADYNGLQKASHITDKLVEMTRLNETIWSCGIASSCEGYQTEAGNWMVDRLLANVCKLNVTQFPYEITHLAEDITGGILVTGPSEADFNNPATGDYLRKYLAGANGASAENKMRVLRYIENMCLGGGAVGYKTESMNGAGSPAAQKLNLRRLGNFKGKQELAKKIAGVKE